MDEKPKITAWNMDEAIRNSDPQLSEVKNNQSLASSYEQLGQAIARDKLDGLDVAQQRRMANDAM